MSKASRGSWFGRNLLLLLGVTTLIISGGLFFVKAPGQIAALDAQASTIAELEQMQSGLEEAGGEEGKELHTALGATGVNQERQESDKLLAKALFETATTWKSGEGYIEARDALKDRYGFTDDSKFMQVFMPGQDQGAYRIAPSGKVYFTDDNLNSRMTSFQPTLVGMDGGDWHYFGLITIDVTSGNGGSASAYIAARYTIDANGVISDVMAYPVPQSPRQA